MTRRTGNISGTASRLSTARVAGMSEACGSGERASSTKHAVRARTATPNTVA